MLSLMTWLTEVHPQQVYRWHKTRRTDMPVGHAVIQRYFDKLDKRLNRNLEKFSKGKCQVLHLGQNNSIYQHKLEGQLAESSSADQDLKVTMDSQMTINQQCTFITERATTSWVTLDRTLTAGKLSFLSTEPWWDIWSAVCEKCGHTGIEYSKGSQRSSGYWSVWHRRDWEGWDIQSWEKKPQGES